MSTSTVDHQPTRQSFRGYAFQGALTKGFKGVTYRVVQETKGPNHHGLVEVVPLDPDTPPSPPVGSVVTHGSNVKKTVLTTPFKNSGGKWAVMIRRDSGIPIYAYLKDLRWEGNPATKRFSVTLTGSDSDADHLKSVMKGHGLAVEVEEMDGS